MIRCSAIHTHETPLGQVGRLGNGEGGPNAQGSEQVPKQRVVGQAGEEAELGVLPKREAALVPVEENGPAAPGWRGSPWGGRWIQR